MLVSMTGFGKATCTLENKKLTIEVKTLNSKQLDVNTRIPGYYKEKEIVIRNLISEKLVRGKIDFSIYAELSGNESGSIIDTEAVKTYFNQLNTIATELGIADKSDILSNIMRMPDVLKTERKELNEEEWSALEQAIIEALNDVTKYRKQEGSPLEKDIIDRIETIARLHSEVEQFENERIERIKERLNQNLTELVNNESYDKNRFEQELIFYLEKFDITEEKVRLNHHCEYFLKTIKMDEPVGKKLGFISQEIGREINTMGSKANHQEIQKLVIQMKDELEKIKEQLLNIL